MTSQTKNAMQGLGSSVRWPYSLICAFILQHKSRLDFKHLGTLQYCWCEINTVSSRPMRILQCSLSPSKSQISTTKSREGQKTIPGLNLDPGSCGGNVPSSWKCSWCKIPVVGNCLVCALIGHISHPNKTQLCGTVGASLLLLTTTAQKNRRMWKFSPHRR